MKILVTGVAGFIGFHVAAELLKRGHEVIGLDNINDYYSQSLKFDRLLELGIAKKEAIVFNLHCVSTKFPDQFQFIRMHLEDSKGLEKLFRFSTPEVVCHLAAQAGVRYSLEQPETYVQSNIVGFFNILENCRHFKVRHLVYASSSSVYGLNNNLPYSVDDRTDSPISLYAASKKSNELMAYTYSHLFKLPTTGLRFFTVYGPWGRPDMALFLFTKAILNNQAIKIFNHGKMERDFTYVDDIVEGVLKVLEKPFIKKNVAVNILSSVYNIGNNTPVNLLDFIGELERALNKKSIKKMKPIQPGDMERTWANVNDFMQIYGYRPKTSIREGVKKFVDWYLQYTLK